MDREAFGVETGGIHNIIISGVSGVLSLLLVFSPVALILTVYFDISWLKAYTSCVLIWASLILCLHLLQITFEFMALGILSLMLLCLLTKLRLKHDSVQTFVAKLRLWLVEFEAEVNKGNDKNPIIVAAHSTMYTPTAQRESV